MVGTAYAGFLQLAQLVFDPNGHCADSKQNRAEEPLRKVCRSVAGQPTRRSTGHKGKSSMRPFVPFLSRGLQGKPGGARAERNGSASLPLCTETCVECLDASVSQSLILEPNAGCPAAPPAATRVRLGFLMTPMAPMAPAPPGGSACLLPILYVVSDQYLRLMKL